MAITRIGNPALADVREPNFRNLLINGDMSLAQRGTSSTGITGNGYFTVDRFKHVISGLGTWTASQSTEVPTGQGFANSFKMDCTTADASPAAGDFNFICQIVEGRNLQYLKKGTSSAESVTISFWVKSNKTGTYICEIFDGNNTRQISKSYTISASDTWEKKTITFPGDTSGAIGTSASAFLQFNFWLAVGSDRSSGTLSTTWTSTTNANRAVGQVNLADNTSNEWYITGVQIEAGTVASDFEFLPADVNLTRCQRYFYTEPNTDNYHAVMNGFYPTTSLFIGVLNLPTTMFQGPSLTMSGNWTAAGTSDKAASNFTVNDSTGNDLNSIQVRADVSSATAGQGANLRNSNDTSAKFQLSCEL